MSERIHCIHCKWSRLDEGKGWYCTLKDYDEEQTTEEQLEESESEFRKGVLYFQNRNGDSLPYDQKRPCVVILGIDLFMDKQRRG